MIKNKAELITRRRNVREFILADPERISFTRRVRVPSSNGGWKWGDPILVDPQLVRIIPAKRRYGDTEVNTEAGQVPLWPYILEGFWNMDISEDDEFEWQGERYVVKDIEPDREERTVAFINYFGAN